MPHMLQSLHEGGGAKKDSRTAAHNLTARKDEHGRSLRNGAPTPILTARKDEYCLRTSPDCPAGLAQGQSVSTQRSSTCIRE